MKHSGKKFAAALAILLAVGSVAVTAGNAKAASTTEHTLTGAGVYVRGGGDFQLTISPATQIYGVYMDGNALDGSLYRSTLSAPSSEENSKAPAEAPAETTPPTETSTEEAPTGDSTGDEIMPPTSDESGNESGNESGDGHSNNSQGPNLMTRELVLVGSGTSSTPIVLLQFYMDSLELGDHLVQVKLMNGQMIEHKFTVSALQTTASPQTGDSTTMIWLFLAAGISGAAVVLFGLKRKSLS